MTYITNENAEPCPDCGSTKHRECPISPKAAEAPGGQRAEGCSCGSHDLAALYHHPKCALAPAAPSERADESKDAPLAAGVEGDELVIRVGVGTLAYCFETGEENQPFDEKANDFRRSYKVTDLHKFAKGVGIRLQDEEEDGSTPLTKIFDEAFIRAVEDAMGVDEDGRIVTKQMLQYGAGLSSQEGVK